MTTQLTLTTDITVYTVETCELETANLDEGDEIIHEGTHTTPIDEHYPEGGEMQHVFAPVIRHDTVITATLKQ